MTAYIRGLHGVSKMPKNGLSIYKKIASNGYSLTSFIAVDIPHLSPPIRRNTLILGLYIRAESYDQKKKKISETANTLSCNTSINFSRVVALSKYTEVY
jgi:hypothetical protein